MGTSGGAVGGRDLDYRIALKRLLDVLVSGIALVVLAVPLLVIAVAIRLDSKGPSIYRQERVGKGGRSFVLFKFRTMKIGSDAQTLGTYIDSKNPHVTRLGHFLRRWGLDELPQLLNVFRGDMSLVGPRPTLMYQVERYYETQMLRLRVKPGLTGWAQVNGRNKMNWPERMEYDLWYVQHWSLRLDAKILVLTPIALMKRDFAYANDVTQDDIVRPG